jgi:hypothetical protein
VGKEMLLVTGSAPAANQEIFFPDPGLKQQFSVGGLQIQHPSARSGGKKHS